MAEFDLQRAFENLHDRLDTIVGKQNAVEVHLGQQDIHIKNLVGNGKPGRMTEVEARVEDLQRYRDNAKGYMAGALAVMVALGWLGHLAIDLLVHK